MSVLNNKENCINKIASIITPYDQLCWPMYKVVQNNHRKFFFCTSATHHLNSFSEKIKHIIPSNQKYSIRALVALGHIYHSGRNRVIESVNCYKEALSKNDTEKCIRKYDLAVILLNLGYDLLVSGEIRQAECYFDKGVKLAKKLQGNEALLAMGLVCKLILHDKQRNLSSAESEANLALRIIGSCQEPWALSILAEIYCSLAAAYCEKYLTKAEGSITIDYINRALDIYGSRVPFYKSQQKLPNEYPIMMSCVRAILVLYYNILGKYDKSIEHGINELEYFHKSYPNNMFIVHHLFAIREKSYILQCKERPIAAEKLLSEVSNASRKMGLIKRSAIALIYRVETRIRLNKLKKAYEDCHCVLDYGGIGNTNLRKLQYNTVYYHSAIIKHKQHDEKLCIKYFSDFFNHMKDFCKGFLDKPVYEKLVVENAFKIIKDPKDIQKCLDNSLKIFTEIYGANHSFVKDYVSENCKDRSGLYEHFKIAGYYLRYWLDCCLEFLSLNT